MSFFKSQAANRSETARVMIIGTDDRPPQLQQAEARHETCSGALRAREVPTERCADSHIAAEKNTTEEVEEENQGGGDLLQAGWTEAEDQNKKDDAPTRKFECNFCMREFASSQ
eukprot:c7741_g2_i1 orf=184-525(+)